MKKAAVFSDIHSNYIAFSACVDDALANGASAFVFLGDFVTDFPDARKTLDLIYRLKSEYPCTIIRGNRERYLLEARQGKIPLSRGTKTGSWLYNYEQLTESDLDLFESLPFYREAELFGIELELAHALRDNDRFFYEKGDKHIDGVASQMKYKYLLTGHSHKQYIYTVGGKTIINPGSVGVARGGKGKAHYALLNIENGEIIPILREVGYDLSAVIHRHFESRFVDCAKYWAIGILYDIITGDEIAVKLLEKMLDYCGGDRTMLDNESLWQEIASSSGLKFTEREITELANS